MAAPLTRRRPTAPAVSRLPAWAAQVPGPSDPLPDQVQQFLDWLRIQCNRPLTTVRAYRQDLAKFVAFVRRRPLAGDFTAAVDRAVLRRYQIEL
ncbi:MAG TPA: site-specific integrase, partial [Candidatus Dormibacteraeota bacterium]|nr:site-specific integrase [Candidatus Dormibacteraeota bacterium]